MSGSWRSGGGVKMAVKFSTGHVIAILFGKADVATGATLAHEMMHAWFCLQVGFKPTPDHVIKNGTLPQPMIMSAAAASTIVVEYTKELKGLSMKRIWSKGDEVSVHRFIDDTRAFGTVGFKLIQEHVVKNGTLLPFMKNTTCSAATVELIRENINATPQPDQINIKIQEEPIKRVSKDLLVMYDTFTDSWQIDLIMDILAGEEGGSEVQKKFSRRHTSEMDVQKLSHALKIFSETEKQLRVSKNQTTWLTAALLQLSSAESSSSLDASDTKSLRNTQERGESFKNLDPTSCNLNTSDKSQMQKDIDEQLESIWNRATGLCQYIQVI
ncbi:hypothetical protein ACLB2K_051617 [Fragaria x ananassa]